MNNFSKRNIHKETPEQIKKEIYDLINNLKEKDSFKEYDNEISKISNDYFLFQKKIIELSNNKINISIKGKNISFNNILQVNTDTLEIASVFLRYTTLANNTGIHCNTGIHWTTGYSEEMDSILPKESIRIAINLKKSCLNINLEEAIQDYFFEHLRQLNTLYYKDIEKLKSFLIPLHETIYFLNIKENTNPLFLESEHYCPSSIIKKLNNNKEMNEVIYLSYDFDINEKISLMKKSIKNNKDVNNFTKN